MTSLEYIIEFFHLNIIPTALEVTLSKKILRHEWVNSLIYQETEATRK